MSSRRRTRRSTSSSNAREEEIEEFILKLQELVPQLKHHGSNRSRIPAEEALKETCNHIKRLRREVEELSSRLSDLLLNNVSSAADADADIIKNIIQS